MSPLFPFIRCRDEAKTSTRWGEVNVCDLEAQEIFLTFPSRKVLFEARITGSRSEEGWMCFTIHSPSTSIFHSMWIYSALTLFLLSGTTSTPSWRLKAETSSFIRSMRRKRWSWLALKNLLFQKRLLNKSVIIVNACLASVVYLNVIMSFASLLNFNKCAYRADCRSFLN